MRKPLHDFRLKRVVIRIRHVVLRKQAAENRDAVWRTTNSGCRLAKRRRVASQANERNRVRVRAGDSWHRTIRKVEGNSCGDSIRRNHVGLVRPKRAARGRTQNGIQVQASLCLPIIQVMRTEKPVSLATYISECEYGGAGKLALNRQVVLFRILRFQMWWELTEKRNWPEL